MLILLSKVAFLDDDDWWLPGKLQAQLEASQLAGGAQMVCTAAVEDRHLIQQQQRHLQATCLGEAAPEATAFSTGGAPLSPAPLPPPLPTPLHEVAALVPEATMPPGLASLPDSLGLDDLPSGQPGPTNCSANGSAKGGTKGEGGAAAARPNPVVTSSVLVRRRLLDRAARLPPTDPLTAAGAPAAESSAAACDCAPLDGVSPSAALVWFGAARYGQDLDLWRRCLALTREPSASGGHRGSGHRGGGHRSGDIGATSLVVCALVRSPMVVYGTLGLNRSTVRKETRQAVRTIVQDFTFRDFTGLESGNANGAQASGAPQRVAQEPGARPGEAPRASSLLVADLIQGFVGV